MMRLLKNLHQEARRWLADFRDKEYVVLDDGAVCRLVCADCDEVIWEGPPGSLNGVDVESMVAQAKVNAREAWSRGERP